MATGDTSDKEVNPLLSDDPFKSEESQKLFEAIDELRTCGANHDIDLPELVIVGDQSVGKSSLLQSLTDIPFPVAGRLCTRFPTLILSRRTPDKPETTKISIEPAMFSSFTKELYSARAERYSKFARERSNITAADFVAVVNEATHLMGIAKATKLAEGEKETSMGARSQNFSDDVLKIEISGPSRSYFSIVDVPGVFQSLTKDLTETEKTGVKSMVASYMRRRQSVIVCVASGTNDLANQAAFDMASEHDPRGSRTVGVITKCDIAQNVDQVLELAQNREKYFDHGWFVVRNRTPSEVQEGLEPLERHIREKGFFDARPWNRLRESRRGTQPLKRFLATLLCSRIQATFPTILSTIRSRQESVQVEIDSLGAPRKTLEQKRTYLTTIAQHFHSLAEQALRGRYDVISTSDMRLRMRVREYNDKFALDMVGHGHSTPFIEIQGTTHASNNSSPGLATTSDLTSPTQPESLPFESKEGSLFGESVSNVGLRTIRSSIPQLEAYSEFEYSYGRSELNPLLVYQHISSSAPYRDLSPEEFRLNDYRQAQPKTPTSQSKASKTTSLFATTPGPSAFGSLGLPATKPTGLFGSPKPNPFAGFGHSTTDPASAPRKPDSLFSSIPPKIRATTIVSQDIERGKSQIYQWIKDEVKSSRGTELQGTLNPDVLPVLFHKQASNWRAKSEAHFLSIQHMTISVIEKLLETICGDKHTRAKLRTLIQQANQQATSRRLSQLFERLSDILTQHLQTNNQAFEEKISHARLLRFQGALERYRSSRTSQSAPALAGIPAFSSPDTQLVINMRDTSALFAELHMSNSQNLEDEIHDTLKSYYDIALNDFIEYVTQLIVERYLNDPKGPLLMFSPIYVGRMDDEEVENLAAEDESMMRRRAEKEDTLARLNRAEGIAMKYT